MTLAFNLETHLYASLTFPNKTIDKMIDTFNIAVTQTANEILGKHRRPKKSWVTTDILDLCDKH